MDQFEYQETLNLLTLASNRQGTCEGEKAALKEAFNALHQSAIDNGYTVTWEAELREWFVSKP
jgi:hypothetical protein